MGEQAPERVNVARLRAADRPEVVSAYVGQVVDVTAAWGRGAGERTVYRGAALAVAELFREAGAYVLVLEAAGGRLLAIRLSRLLTIAPAGAAES